MHQFWFNFLNLVTIIMIGKFVFLFVVLAFAAQSNEARTVTIPKLSIDDILKTIEELINKVKEAIDKFVQLLKRLEEKIKDIVSKINLPEILAGIKQKIEDIINAAGIDIEAAAHCIAEEQSAVEELTKNATEGVQNCVAGINELRNKLHDEITEVKNKAGALIEDLTGKANQCVKDHGLDIPAVINCLQGLSGTASEEIHQFITDVEASIANAEKDIAEAAGNLADCITAVAHDIAAQESAIIDDFKQCIDTIIATTTAAAN